MTATEPAATPLAHQSKADWAALGRAALATGQVIDDHLARAVAARRRHNASADPMPLTALSDQTEETR